MIISPNDKKTYQQLVLDNGLRVLLIESDMSTKAACSLVVNVGSFNDPVDRPGFAHFVEHLLFNHKQNDSLMLNEYVSSHGGHCNAWTGTEHSCFHFDVPHRYLNGTLSRFADMFFQPQFSVEAIEREQKAIHSEYKLKLKDDGRRIQQVHKETSNKEHPFSKFSVGNRHTLSDLPQRPVLSELNEFWQQHYCASKMTLVVVSESNENAATMVTNHFSKLNDLGHQAANDESLPPLYQNEHLGNFIQIKPLKQLHKLNITFALPDIKQWYKSKMSSFVAHLINYEGPDSLFELLRQKNLINMLNAGNGIQGSNFKDFNISFELTELGEQNLDEVLEHTFSYINKLKSELPPTYIYEEQQKLADISFNYQEDIKPVLLANSIALNMQFYSNEDILFGDYRMDGFQTEDWHSILRFFSASNMRVTLLSQDIETDREAHWYHTPYSVMTIPAETLEQLDHVAVGQFVYPKPNPFLKDEITLQHEEFSNTTPILLSSSKYFRFWFKQDVSFRVPKGNIYMSFDLQNGVKTKLAQTQMRLFCELFLDTVSEEHYQAEMAGLHYNLYAHNTGITIYTAGLSNNQHQLMRALLKKLLTIEFSQQRFEELKKQLIKHWQNSLNSKPINQLFTQLNQSLLPDLANSQELAEILEKVEYEAFCQFRKHLFDSVFIEALVYGNWSQQDAELIYDEFNALYNESQYVPELPRPQINSLGPSADITVDVNQNDQAALYYLQAQPTSFDVNDAYQVEQKAQFILLSSILAPFTFDYLRQERNLGYLAGSGYMPLATSAGIAIYVQSHNIEANVLMNHIEDMVVAFLQEIEALSDSEFERHKNAAKNQYQEQPSNLQQKAQFLWSAIGQQDFSFDLREKLVAHIEKCSQQEIVNCVQNWLNGQYPTVKLYTTNKNLHLQ